MRLKEIKPGMVIHCKNDEEKKALLEEAERLGYLWANGYKPTEFSFPSNSLVFREDGLSKRITWSVDGNKNTEFSDLILPELTAEEAIKINTELCAGTCEECPLYNVDGYSDCDDLCINNPEKAVELLAKWKYNHEKKEPEIETVDICRIIEIQTDGRKRCVHEEDLASGSTDAEIKIMIKAELKRYCMEHDGEFIAVHEVVSRVKAVE